VACVLATVLVGVFSAVGVLLRSSEIGAYFGVADQWAMVLLGLLLGGGALLAARPLVIADTSRVRVRNFGWWHDLEWSDVDAVSFPDGAAWARLELPDDEYLSVMAVQATDGQRAVRAVTGLRALHAGAVAAADA
jgi:hypothetical protein